MAALQPIRGTHDLLPDDARRHRHVIETARTTLGRYGYQEIATPIFESTDVFQRTLGDTSDIVTKEMYTFSVKGEEQVTLRPENTAGVARAFISNGLAQHLPLKFFYAGPMFRYERPQKGRQRQFHQIGIELLGVAEPLGDVEVVAAGAHVLESLGVLGKTRLELNTLGDTESRTAYRNRLIAYFGAHLGKLSADSRDRLDRNPLRILDSKDPADREIVAGAPLFESDLTEAARNYFDAVKRGLDSVGVAYHLNPRLVRGLDYYCHTAFEFTTDALGAQGAVIAGGRYDGLIETMGGPPTPGVGWAGGIERLAMLANAELAAPRPIALVPMGAAAETEALKLAQYFRRAGFTIELGYRGNIKKRMARADKLKARAAIIIGDDELAKKAVTLRDLDSGEQRAVPFDQLEQALAQYR
ncbi:MAG: histidine--tRNA ligase [Alphaproteobacteria bacterium]